MGWNMEQFAANLQNHPDYNKRIFHLSGLDDKSVNYLYQHAKFLAFCSYTEGFGLPLIEAIRRGTPVIASDIPVLREVAGEYCIWFEQDNANELCARVREYTENEDMYHNCRDRLASYVGHGWEEVTAKMEKIVGIVNK